jgi:hypothetical protein
MDWISVALAAAPVLREALERLRNANEVRRFFYEFRAAVEDDKHVPHDAKGELAERLFYLLADPTFQSALDNYLERLDITEASSEIESFVRPLVEELVSPEESTDLLAAVMRDVHRAANRAQSSDREANFLQTERILDAIQSQQVGRFAFLDLEWAPDWPQKALAKLGRESAEELARLTSVRERSGLGLYALPPRTRGCKRGALSGVRFHPAQSGQRENPLPSSSPPKHE